MRAAGASSHGLAARNYALVQLMLQAGLRVGEVAMLRMADITIGDRSGSVRVRHGKGLKAREVPLNATARRALRQFLEGRPTPPKKTDAPLFVSSRETAMPVRTIQAVVANLARRARLKRVAVSAHTLRHTFALGYLRDNPGKLVELASQLGHDSLDTTAVYTRPSRDDLAADLERSHTAMMVRAAALGDHRQVRRCQTPVLCQLVLARIGRHRHPSPGLCGCG